ncbi:MAG: flagellar hook-associated protein FlgL [Sedimentisphaerales bacterium]|nr:flagellar hook-associated protein FlgL [Sedimentisphaerales bacterium]
MSGSLNNIYNNVSYALLINTEAMTKLQEQVSTGSRINRISDDSTSAYKVLGLETEQRSLSNYINTITETMDSLEISSYIVQSMVSSISNVRTLLTQITSGTYNEVDRTTTAEGIDEILEELLALANRKNNGQYLFGGSSSGSEPYLAERTDGKITSVTYHGSFKNRDVEVADGMQTASLLVGEEVFCSNDRGTSQFFGSTGASEGSGTSSVKGDIWLTVTGSEGNWTLSIDGGLTTFSSDGTDTNLAVVNSTNGQVLYVDTTQISQTGVELVRTSGTHDLFDTLISIRDILINDANFSESQIRELQETTLASIEEISNLLVKTEVSLGMKINFLENLKNNLTDIQYNAEDESTRLQEADIAQITVDLARREVLYQMSLSIAGTIMSVSLLDYID